MRHARPSRKQRVSEQVTLDNVLPLVVEDRGNRGLWLGLGAIAIVGLSLFATLEANRQSVTEPPIASPRDYAFATAPRPELTIPQTYEDGRSIPAIRAAPATLPQSTISQLPPVRLTRTRSSAEPVPQQSPSPTYAPPPVFTTAMPDPGRAAPNIVYDAVQAIAAGEAAVSSTRANKAVAVGGGDRTYLVSQGTLIFAVLETAMDSTQSGQVRAMISTNVFNALGSRVLIPRGSRLFGEYKGELGSGQNRAQVIWIRLIRPDGATIALDSPASDQLGRAGVKGRVDTHFAERLLGALLQSTIDFGAAVASRSVTSGNGVIISLPAAAQASGSQLIPPPPKPTLKVRHGTRLAVFVSRDLDFSAVE